jgi:succinyl-CoA synthetase alpha subunit
MAILVDSDTRLVVQGLTGREGSFHAGRNKEYGTDLVAGVTPGKGGSDVQGTPVFDTVTEAVRQTGANTSLIFVPARFACDALLEAYDAGIDVIVTITENIPAMDMARAVPYIGRGPRRAALIGPNCPGLISPGMANVGIIPGEICMRGPVGLVSRSGTLTYQIIHELTQRGIGQSTCVGIGGDPIPGSDFIDVLERFEADPETELVVLVGEIGGDAEERAAAWVKDNMTKPVVAYIAGLTAPPGKRMGHAGAIISGSKGTASAKIDALRAAGIEVGANPTEVAEIVARTGGLSR